MSAYVSFSVCDDGSVPLTRSVRHGHDSWQERASGSEVAWLFGNKEMNACSSVGEYASLAMHVHVVGIGRSN